MINAIAYITMAAGGLILAGALFALGCFMLVVYSRRLFDELAMAYRLTTIQQHFQQLVRTDKCTLPPPDKENP